MSVTSGPRRPGLEGDIVKARRVEWIAIAYLFSTIATLILVMSGSLALKSEFVGDALSLIAPVLFLIGDRVSLWKPTERYPFGFERAVSAGYLGAALALFATGTYLLGDAALKLAYREHPAIGGMSVFGHIVWIGWLAIPTLLWSSVPAFFLGRAKERLARKINDKVLLADAQTSSADWQSAGAAILGILGVAWGFWWADAVAALFISLEIVRAAAIEVWTALGDIIDRRPQVLGSKELDPLPETMTEFLKSQAWIRDAVVRVRERGREFAVDATIVPRADTPILDQMESVSKAAGDLDDRMRDLTLTLVREIPAEIDRVRADQPES